MRFCGIGILPMLHGLEAHATRRPFSHTLSGREWGNGAGG
jgi:hypothetical protein